MKNKLKCVYIAGPITGRPTEEYLAHFARAAADLTSLGYRPLNPTTQFGRLQPLFNRLPYRLQMLIDLYRLAHCDKILLLNGWNFSRGAKLEKALADFLDIPTLNFYGNW